MQAALGSRLDHPAKRPPGVSARGRCGLAAAIVVAAIGALQAAIAAPCSPDGGEAGTIVAIGPDLSLTLADGRRLRLAGITPVGATADRPDGATGARAALSSWLVGEAATIRTVGAAADRWGRLPALVFLSPQGADAVSVATAMVARGLARGHPEPGAAACWPAVLAAEQAARQAVLGLWGDPYYAVRRADDGPSLAGAAGGMVVAEGRVAHVGQARKRLYVDLGPGRDSLALRLDRRDSFILGQLGSSQSAWMGRRIRVRGTLEDRGGPTIEVSGPDQVEVLDGIPSR